MCVHVSNSNAFVHEGKTKKKRKEHKWGKNACRIIITLCDLSCMFILLYSHVYVSEQIGPARTF